jgi:cell division transport system permease protein
MIRAYLLAHVQAFQRAWRRMASQPASTMLSILVIGIAVTLPAGLYAFLGNIANLTRHINTDPHINIYLAVGASSEEARQIEVRLKAHPQVQAVNFISRDDALKEMKNTAHLADLLSSLDTNPLPHAFSVVPKTIDSGALEGLRKEFAAFPRVEYVLMDFEWAQKLARISRLAEHLIALITLLLSIAVIFITGNTIRLQILTQREEIEVSRLIGATYPFIRRPFLYFGVLQGCLSGMVSLLLLVVVLWWIDRQVQALTISYLLDFHIYLPTPQQSLWLLGGISLLGWLGAYFSTSFYFKHPEIA